MTREELHTAREEFMNLFNLALKEVINSLEVSYLDTCYLPPNSFIFFLSQRVLKEILSREGLLSEKPSKN